MRRLFLLVAALFFIESGSSAQEIRRVEADFTDYLPLLRNAGYEVFSFDISSLKDETYVITFVTKEYVNNELSHDSTGDPFTLNIVNKKMISEFSKENQDIIISRNDAYDLERGIYRLAEKITIGFSPSEADSLKAVRMSVENLGSMGAQLSLKPLSIPGNVSWDGICKYQVRPFRVGRINIGGFTPLVLVGSMWYDKDFDIVRFCVDNEFEPDLSSKSLEFIPHYYVIGINVVKQDS